MKFNRIYLIIISLIAVVFVGCNNDDPGETAFTNKIYVDLNAKVYTTLIKPANAEATKTITASIAKPIESRVDIVYKVDLSRVDLYNQSYLASAIALPAENYEFTDNKATIVAGGVHSTAVSINFKGINTLDRDIVYVLPVTMESATNIDMLESARTIYYLFKGAALINVVGDIAENSLSIDWKNKDVMNGLKTMTMEALVRARDFTKISSIMGIEDTFLMRIGDTDRDMSQLQIACKSNFPAANPAKNLPKNEWIHIALAYNLAAGNYTIYINGVMQSEVTNGSAPTYSSGVDLGNSGFYIGKSFDDNRWIDGEISECRVWNIIRTQEQIATNMYEVDPAAEGLVAYWKFDEGSGLNVKDHTVNGNNAVAIKEIKWTSVSLPAK